MRAQKIDIEIWDYSEKPSVSDVERTIKSAVDHFPNLSTKINKLHVFVFNLEQIKEGSDIEEMRFHSGIPVGKQDSGWGLMYSYWNKNIGLIEVKIEEFMRSSDTRRKFIARHELGHIFLSGPPGAVTLKDVLIDSSLKGIVDRECKRILTIWAEYKVNSLMMRLFPELTIQYMDENPAEYSQTMDRKILNRYETQFERLLVTLRLIIIYEMWLVIMKKAPSSLKKKVWKSLKRSHSESIELLKRQALQVNPNLQNVRVWFTEDCLENRELLIRRVLELSLFP